MPQSAHYNWLYRSIQAHISACLWMTVTKTKVDIFNTFQEITFFSHLNIIKKQVALLPYPPPANYSVFICCRPPAPAKWCLQREVKSTEYTFLLLCMKSASQKPLFLFTVWHHTKLCYRMFSTEVVLCYSSSPIWYCWEIDCRTTTKALFICNVPVSLALKWLRSNNRT